MKPTVLYAFGQSGQSGIAPHTARGAARGGARQGGAAPRAMPGGAPAVGGAGEWRHAVPAEYSTVFAAAFLCGGERVAVSTAAGGVHVLRCADEEEEEAERGSGASRPSPVGSVGDEHGRVRAHEGAAYALAAVDRTKLLSGGADGFVRVWDAANADKEVRGRVRCCGHARSAQGWRGGTGSRGARGQRARMMVRISPFRCGELLSMSAFHSCDVPTDAGRRSPRPIPGRAAPRLRRAQESDDGLKCLSESRCPAGDVGWSQPEVNAVASPARSADSALVATGAILPARFDLNLGEFCGTLGTATASPHAAYLHDIAQSADGRTCASASEDGTVALWDTRSDRATQVFNVAAASPAPASGAGGGALAAFARPHAGYASCVAMSADGNWVVAGSGARCVTFWSTRMGVATARVRTRATPQAVLVTGESDALVAFAAPYLSQLSVAGREVCRRSVAPRSVYALARCDKSSMLCVGGHGGSVQVLTQVAARDAWVVDDGDGIRPDTWRVPPCEPRMLPPQPNPVY